MRLKKHTRLYQYFARLFYSLSLDHFKIEEHLIAAAVQIITELGQTTWFAGYIGKQRSRDKIPIPAL